eukprot:UN10562
MLIKKDQSALTQQIRAEEKAKQDAIERMQASLNKQTHWFFKITQSLKIFAFVIMMAVVWVLELTYIVPFSNYAEKHEQALLDYEYVF